MPHTSGLRIVSTLFAASCVSCYSILWALGEDGADTSTGTSASDTASISSSSSSTTGATHASSPTSSETEPDTMTTTTDSGTSEPGVTQAVGTNTDSENSTNSDSTTTSGGICGNGITEPPEQCDGGGVNTAICNKNCTDSMCGDNLLNIDAGEKCDNNTPECRFDCTFCGDGTVDPQHNEVCDPKFDNGCDGTCNLKCGNGTVDAGEPCDKMVANQAEGFCDTDCQRAGLFAFVTSADFNGALGGILGADQKCVTAAAVLHKNDPGAANNYHAWISNKIISPALLGRMTGCGKPYYSSDGQKMLAKSTAALITMGPEKSIELTELKTTVKKGDVWTNTFNLGLPGPYDCVNWTSGMSETDIFGAFGNIFNLSEWTDSSKKLCGERSHLYCFEQATGC